MAFDTHLKIDGVDGESAAKGMEKQIEVFSFSWGVTNSVNVYGAGHGGGKSSFSSLSIMKKVDKASSVLMKLCATGAHKPTAVLTLRKASGEGGQQVAFVVITLTSAYVESVQLSGSSGGDDTPTESVSIVFEQIKFEYSTQDAKGVMAKAASFDYNIKTVHAK